MDDEGITEDARQQTPHRTRGFEGQANTATLGFDQYLWVLRRQWRLIALVTLLGVVLSALYSLLVPRTAMATTTVNLNVIMTEPFSSQRPASGLLDSSTEAAIARSHVVAIRAADILGDDVTASQVRDSSEVETGQSETVAKIVYDAPSKDEAVDGSAAVAEAYLEFRSEQAEDRAETIIESLTDQIDGLNKTLNATNKTIAGTEPTSTQHVQALTQQQQILTELDGLLSERNALRSVDTRGGIVLSPAEDNPVHYTPNRKQLILLGGAAGFVLGIVLAFARNPFDRRLRGAREASRILRAPVLAAPSGGGADDASDEKLRLARERLLTDVGQLDSLAILDTTNDGAPSRLTRQLSSWLKRRAPQLQVITPRADQRPAVIAALRDADAAVLMFDRHSADTTSTRWFGDEADATGTPVVGIIERPTDPSEQSATTVLRRLTARLRRRRRPEPDSEPEPDSAPDPETSG